MDISESLLKKAGECLKKQPPVLRPELLDSYVDFFINRAPEFIKICREHGSPLYVIEEKVLKERAEQFTSAFRESAGDIQVYYALKSNNHPALAACLVKSGLGLDVSGGPELETALECGCEKIIFSGPGKSSDEIKAAVINRDKVTLLMDSFGELERVEATAGEYGVKINAGVRLTTNPKGLWRKFGIPLSDLEMFLKKADTCPHVRISGLQFHTSWNLDPSAQTAFIAQLGGTLRHIPFKYLSALEFIDIGGGYWPPLGEWLQWKATPEGQLHEVLMPGIQPEKAHYRFASSPIETFASKIGEALRTHIFPYMNCRICMEPGRWLCNDAMHILLTVMDKKADDIVITNGGIHMTGWERYESDYCPVINLTRPSKTERECFIFGSLCTPHDIWGFGYFGNGIEPGDILMIPNQGAYTYSLRQNFIKPPAKTILLPS